jgi:predicted ribosomally synthesized peptide with SipW-like signal peptide
MSRKLPGLRDAIIVYVLIVVAALGGVAAHALWSQSGTVTVNVTAGTWAPTGTVNALRCKRESDELKSTDVSVAWDAVDANEYRLAATMTPENPRLSTQKWTVSSGATDVVETLKLIRDDASGSETYILAITPKFGDKHGTPTEFTVVLSQKNEKGGATANCTLIPKSGPGV